MVDLLGERCTHPGGCDSRGTLKVALILVTETKIAGVPLSQKVTLGGERRCLAHRPALAESFLTDRRWHALAANFMTIARKASLGVAIDAPARGLTTVHYYDTQAELDAIEVWAMRPDGKHEFVGKTPGVRTGD